MADFVLKARTELLRPTSSNLGSIVKTINTEISSGVKPIEVSINKSSISRIAKNINAQLKTDIKPIDININTPNINKIVKSINSQLSNIKPINLSVNIGNVNNAIKNIKSQLATIKPINIKVNTSTVSSATQSVKTLSNSVNILTASTNAATSGFEKLGRQAAISIRRFGAFALVVSGFYKLSGAISNSIGEALEFQDTMVKIGQVTGLATKDLKGLENEARNLATQFGVSSKELINATEVLAQAGYTATETQKAMALLAKVQLSGTFSKDIRQNAEGLIAIQNQFGVAVDGLQAKFDAASKVSKAFAIESEDIIAAVKRTGGAFAATGGSFEQFISLLTSVRATTRESAESIATGFRTISTRLQRPRTVEFFKTLGIALRDQQGQFVGTYEAIERISNALAKIPTQDPIFARVTEELGGYRQISKSIPLIKEFAKAEEARRITMISAGDVENDAIRRQESLLTSFTKLREELALLVSNFVNDKWIRTFIDVFIQGATAATRFADALRPLIPIVAALGALKTVQVAPAFGRGLTKELLGRNKGGTVPGIGSKDTVPSILTPGEFVIRKESAQKIGLKNLTKLNQYNKGGATGFIPDNSPIRGAMALGVTGAILSTLSSTNDSLKEFGDIVGKAGVYLAAFSLIVGKKQNKTEIGLQDRLSSKLSSDNLDSDKLTEAFGMLEKYSKSSKNRKGLVSLLDEVDINQTNPAKHGDAKGAYSNKKIFVNTSQSASEIAATIIHELTHYKQDKEGKLKGVVNPSVDPEGYKNSKIEKEARSNEDIFSEFNKNYKSNPTAFSADDDILNIFIKRIENRIRGTDEFNEKAQFSANQIANKDIVDIDSELTKLRSIRGSIMSQEFDSRNLPELLEQQYNDPNVSESEYQATQQKLNDIVNKRIKIEQEISNLTKERSLVERKLTRAEAKAYIAVSQKLRDLKNVQDQLSNFSLDVTTTSPKFTKQQVSKKESEYQSLLDKEKSINISDDELDLAYSGIYGSKKNRTPAVVRFGKFEGTGRVTESRDLSDDELATQFINQQINKNRMSADEDNRIETERKRLVAEEHKNILERQEEWKVNNDSKIYAENEARKIKAFKNEPGYYFEESQEIFSESKDSFSSAKSERDALVEERLKQNKRNDLLSALGITQGVANREGMIPISSISSAEGKPEAYSDIENEYIEKLNQIYLDNINKDAGRIPQSKSGSKINVSTGASGFNSEEDLEIFTKTKKQEARRKKYQENEARKIKAIKSDEEYFFRETEKFNNYGSASGFNIEPDLESFTADSDKKILAKEEIRAKEEAERKAWINSVINRPTVDNKEIRDNYQDVGMPNSLSEVFSEMAPYNANKHTGKIITKNVELSDQAKDKYANVSREDAESYNNELRKKRERDAARAGRGGRYTTLGRARRATSLASKRVFDFFDPDAPDNPDDPGRNNFNKLNKRFGSNKLVRGIGKIGMPGMVLGAVAGDTLSGWGNQRVQKGDASGVAMSAAGGALTGAATGAGFGALFGPLGIAIGGATGAIYGFTTSFMEADANLKSVNFQKSITPLQDNLSNFSQGLGTALSVVPSLSEGLKSFEDRINNSSGADLTTATGQFKELTPQLSKMFYSIAEGSKSFESFEAVVGDNLRSFARLRNVNYGQLSDEFKKIIEKNKENAKSLDGLTKASEEASNRLLTINAFAESVKIAGESLNDFKGNINRLLNGGFSDRSSLFNRTSEKSVQEAKRLDQFTGGDFSKELENALQVDKMLPSILRKASMSSVDDGGVVDSIRDSLPDGYAKDLISGAIAEMVGPAGEENKFAQKLANDFDGVVKELKGKLDPLNDIYKELSSNIYSASQEFASALSEIAKRQEEISGRRGEILSMRGDQERFQASAQRRDVNFSLLRQVENAQLQNISGTSFNNPEYLADRLKNATNRRDDLSKQIETASPQELQSLIRAREEETRVINSSTNALKYLGDASNRTALLQEQLARAQERQQAKTDFATRFAVAGNQERMQMMKSINAATNARSLEQVKPEDRQGIVDILNQFKDQRMFNGKTGQERLQELVGTSFTDAGVNATTADMISGKTKDPEQVSLINEINKQYEQSATALSELNRVQTDNLNTINITLEYGFTNTIAAIKESFQNRLKEDNQRQVDDSTAKIDKLTKQQEDFKKLAKYGITDQQSLEVAQQQIVANAGLSQVQTDDKNLSTTKDKVLKMIQNANGNLASVQDQVLTELSGYDQEGISEVRKNLKDKQVIGTMGGATEIDSTQAAIAAVESLYAKEKEKNKKQINEFTKKQKNISPTMSNALMTNYSQMQKDVSEFENVDINSVNTDIEKEKKRREALMGTPQGFNSGGFVPGKGNSDTVPAMLTPGEFVIRKGAAQSIGYQRLQQLNSLGGRAGARKGYNSGGIVSGNDSNFEQAIKQFSQTTDKLIETLKAFPSEIAHTINGRVEVIINGAEVLTRIMPEVQDLIESKVKDGIRKFSRDNFPELGAN